MSKFNPFASSTPKNSDKKGDDKKGLETVDEEKDLNPDNQEKEKEPELDEKEICQMKRGDYMIHVYVEQCKNIKMDGEDKLDPIVQLNCFG